MVPTESNTRLDYFSRIGFSYFEKFLKVIIENATVLSLKNSNIAS